MPLGVFEQELLRLLAANRNPDSYVGGATVLNQHAASPRTSKDVDVFHDTIDSLGQSADRDIATLKAAGFKDLHLGALAWAGTGKDPGLSLPKPSSGGPDAKPSIGRRILRT